MKTDKINSTERLLNIIRGRKDQAPGHAWSLPPKKRSSEKRPKGTLFRRESKFQKSTISVGVDIGQDRLRLVKAVRSEGTWKVVQHRGVDLLTGSGKESEGFSDILRRELESFCSDAEKADIWTTMSSASVEVRQIHLPKVPEAQLEQAVYWTLKKEASFDEKAFFFDFEILGEVDEAGGRKLRLMCYTAPIGEVEGIKKLFSEAGFALTGITIVPFVEQNIFKTEWMRPGKYTACLFIGNEYSRIDLFVDGKMALTRDIRTGVNSMIEMIEEVLQSRFGPRVQPEPESGALQTGPEAVQAGMEALQTPSASGNRQDRERARRILLALGRDEGESLVVDDSHSIGRPEMEAVIAPVLERLVRQMERTFDHYSTNLGYERIGEVYMSSVLPLSQAMIGYFEKQLGIKSSIFDPIGSSMPEENLTERVALIPAFGLAFSDTAYTPNCIFTYKDKAKKAAEVRLNRIIFASLLVIVLVCSVVFADLLMAASRHKSELGRLEQQLHKQTPVLSRESVLGMISQYKEQQGRAGKLGERYAGMAVLSELSSLLPDAASLTSVRYTSREKTGKSAGKSEKSKKNGAGMVLLEGTIRGERGLAEAALASYVMKLTASPLFRDVTVTKGSSAGSSGPVSGLAFTLKAEIGPHK